MSNSKPSSVMKLYYKKKAMIDSLKNHPCMDCKGLFPPECMDYDHRPGVEKVEDIGTLLSRACLPRILAEIAKCDLVCANCHRIRERKRKHANGHA